ncbi:MAG TPA: chemotaxis protein CheD [Deltaproteobacteria bacterium]|nr:chemotaxis protein CheD [Deltaproteobacteria bacterium]HQI00134.1 chemotaxis protein CheD [Deltaproteobacteria bacterium]HQJ08915.1 chemotaxis protein CheD [Deltaproteobacteria bacterium]
MKTTAVRPMNCEFASEGLLWIDKIATGVGIILFNPSNKLAAGVHILRGLSQGKEAENPAYFADTAIDYVLKEFRSKGMNGQISVAIAGGASMLSSGQADNIGEQLVRTVKSLLSKNNLQIKLEGVGGNRLRTMILNIDEGKIKIS